MYDVRCTMYDLTNGGWRTSSNNVHSVTGEKKFLVVYDIRFYSRWLTYIVYKYYNGSRTGLMYDVRCAMYDLTNGGRRSSSTNVHSVTDEKKFLVVYHVRSYSGWPAYTVHLTSYIEWQIERSSL